MFAGPSLYVPMFIRGLLLSELSTISIGAESFIVSVGCMTFSCPDTPSGKLNSSSLSDSLDGGIPSGEVLLSNSFVPLSSITKMSFPRGIALGTLLVSLSILVACPVE
jgi:hypothetical protein